jgi:flagellar basal-body rod protein FlgG
MAMIRAFNTAATGMNAQQLVLDNTANNLANLNTTAFKTSQIEFQDLLYSTLRQPGSQSTQGQQLPTGLQIGNGVRVAGNTKIFSTGALVSTSNPLNVAIQGDGFFQIQSPTGGTTLYTRDGSFSLNAQRQLVTAAGYFLQPQLTIPQNVQSISIGTDGTVSVVNASSPNTSTTVGQLQIATFANPAGLSSNSQNLYTPTPASGAVSLQTPGQNGTGALQSGYLEQSNVDVVGELVNLIQAQRAYEFNTKAITVADEMLSSTNDLVR